MNAVYAFILSTWFAFRQSAHLDASDVYVPHPWKRAWLGITVGVFGNPHLMGPTPSRLPYDDTWHAMTWQVLGTPALVDGLIDRKPRSVALYAAAMLAPWLSARLDPTLRQRYNFECRLKDATVAAAVERGKRSGGAARRGANRSGRGEEPREEGGGIRRVQSEVPLPTPSSPSP